MIAPPLVRESRALDREVCRLRSVAREQDLLGRLGVDERGHLLARFCQRVARHQPKLMQGRSASERLREEGAHRLECLGQEWRGGLVIEIDLRHGWKVKRIT